MCRLFGFRSVIQSQVHRSLLDADNALAAQSSQHPDGWGVAFYVDGSPHVTRSSETALSERGCGGCFHSPRMRSRGARHLWCAPQEADA